TPADPQLLAALAGLVSGEEPAAAPAASAQASAAATTEPALVRASSDMTDAEFDSLLDAINSPSSSGEKTSTPDTSSTSDDISDDEFEALLDELHGKNKGPGITPAAPAASAG